MTTAYRLDFYDISGTLQAVLTSSAAADGDGEKSGFLSLAYTKRVNKPGLMQFVLRGDHEILTSLADKWQIEVHRKPDSAAWARDFVGIYRQPKWTISDRKTFVGLCPGLTSMLGWRIVNWAANIANRTKFTSAKAETIMNTLVSYNAAANATTGNGRKRNGAITGLTVEADGAEGNTVDWYCAQANLLETLQELAQIAGGDFDLVKTSPTAWQFRWYTGQLGTDRTVSVIFSVELGNMANVHYSELRIQEKTVACVWGQGEDAGRDYVTRQGANYSSSNDIEMYVDAKDIDQEATAALNARGDQKLKEAQMVEVFEFDVLQAPQTRYGVHYFLGDKVTAVNPFSGVSLPLKVDAVSISFDQDGSEKVMPEFVTPP
jgi:hypothetical protein